MRRYGSAYQPGLIPIDTRVPGDTIDSRQREETSNGALILNDVWHVTERRQFQFSGFYRYYTLDVRPFRFFESQQVARKVHALATIPARFLQGRQGYARRPVGYGYESRSSLIYRALGSADRHAQPDWAFHAPR